MKVVITGGLGFIGTNLTKKLLSVGHEVTVFDNLSVQIHGDLPSSIVPDGADFVRTDICDLAERHDLLEGIDVVFHLAAETGTAQSMYQMSHYTRVNCTGTSALLEAIAKCKKGPKYVVLASSRSVYGEGAYTLRESPGPLVNAVPRTKARLEAGKWDPIGDVGQSLLAIPTPESAAFVPGSVYAATKAAQEMLLTSASIALGIRTAVLRFQNVYGEGQSLQNPYTGIISIFYNRARQGLGISVYEDGLESRDFVHINDVVDALTACIETELPNGIALNIGSGIATSVSSLAVSLLKASGFQVPVSITGQYRLGDIRHCYADISQAKKYLAFSPKMSLESGLARFSQWAASQPVHVDRSEQAADELRYRGLAGE